MANEQPFVIPCHGDSLVCVLHEAASPIGVTVVIVVGGPQYRVGSHRQFVVTARRLAERGVSVLRFDYRGMGDSDGEPRDFTAVDDDIEAVMDWVGTQRPSDRIMLMGLCDAASAILMYAADAKRHISGLILQNPWVRTEAGLARSQTRHYYLKRLADPAFWRKIASLGWNPARSFADLGRNLTRAALGDSRESEGYIGRMLLGLERTRMPILLQMSGQDLTAREFEDLVRRDNDWSRHLRSERTCWQELRDADHTFSSPRDLDEAINHCSRWLHQLTKSA